MRLAILLAIGLVLGGAVVAVAPTASACSSDPDWVCGVIGALDECGTTTKYTDPVATVKSCLP